MGFFDEAGDDVAIPNMTVAEQNKIKWWFDLGFIPCVLLRGSQVATSREDTKATRFRARVVRTQSE